MTNILSVGARNTLSYLTKYSFNKGEATVIDGRGLKRFIEADASTAIRELVTKGWIQLVDVDSKAKTITVRLLKEGAIPIQYN